MTITKPLAAAFLVLGLVSTTLTFAANVITLNVPLAGFGQSQVLAWSWGASNSGTAAGGGGAGSGKANFQDLSFTRAADSQSPKFLEALATGKHISSATLQDGPLLITLTDVLVSSYSTGESADRKSTLTENISLNFARFTFQVNDVSFTSGTAENAAP